VKIEKKTRKSKKKGENRKQKTENTKKKEGPEYPGEGAAITSAAGSFQFNGFTK
jgi:hypothetical protein